MKYMVRLEQFVLDSMIDHSCYAVEKRSPKRICGTPWTIHCVEKRSCSRYTRCAWNNSSKILVEKRSPKGKNWFAWNISSLHSSNGIGVPVGAIPHGNDPPPSCCHVAAERSVQRVLVADVDNDRLRWAMFDFRQVLRLPVLVDAEHHKLLRLQAKVPNVVWLVLRDGARTSAESKQRWIVPEGPSEPI